MKIIYKITYPNGKIYVGKVKYFTISGMPIASSQYWNMVHGYTPDDVRQDEEGMQTMRVLGRNMAFLIKSIALGKQEYGMPETEARTSTNFIR